MDRISYLKTLNYLTDNKLNTVCMEANCPNRYECFAKKTATFLILGDKCTRNCKYCDIKTGISKVDENEPEKIRKAVEDMGIKYAVITSVNRDDLPDNGAGHFAKVIKALNCTVEVLIPDFIDQLDIIAEAKPFVINHNIEVVKPLFKQLRPQGNYNTSLQLLKKIKQYNIISKSGLMLGFGETKKDIIDTLKDLKEAEVDIVTIGQYLAPSETHFPIKKIYSDEEFKEIKTIAQNMGFKHVECGKMVRSSYHAEMAFNKNN
ncbi:lipoyl synthase [Candidatus Woesearchaeota archaeon]|nr:lipoyl synthase [Candidatus Woesearchaeota archaeon]